MEKIIKLIEETTPLQWKAILLDKINISKHLKESYLKVEKIISNKKFLPKKEEIFKCLSFCDLFKIKVVILGQDPYPNYNKGVPYAHGLSFSCPKNISSIPGSLRNIFKEIQRVYPDKSIRTNPNLEDWAKQGVLLLNTILTVNPYKPNSHSKLGWEGITDFIIKVVVMVNPNCVFLLLGKVAQDKISLIESVNPKAKIVTAGHPSPQNTRNPLVGSACFHKVDLHLKTSGLGPIDW